MSCFAMSGRVEEAKLACVAVLQTDPNVRISGIKDRTPFRRPEDIAKISEAYRIAGVPE
jgi:hypothetical protein